MFLIFFKCTRVNPGACHVSLRGFFEFLIFFKCPRVNPIVCHVSKSMFCIQFGPYICYFCSIRSQFLLILTNLILSKMWPNLIFISKL